MELVLQENNKKLNGGETGVLFKHSVSHGS